jgi:hypothetical protein
MSEQLQQQIDALTARLETYEAEMIEWRKVNLSRVGPVGPRGERGIPGLNGKEGSVGATGDRGPAGIGIRGEKGEPGKDSTVPGPRGETGASIVGPPGPTGATGPASTVPGPRGETGAPGRDAQISIGKVSVGDNAAASIRVENGIHYLDLVLPRGTKGDVGPAGPSVEGPAGKDGVIKLEADTATIAHLESKFRRNWKDDIQAGIRGHFQESHTAKS